MLHSPKLAILQSLDALDQQQMDEVLVYIKDVLKQPTRAINSKEFKREALKEIRQALRIEKKKGFSLAL
jgi:hypothetical protein